MSTSVIYSRIESKIMAFLKSKKYVVLFHTGDASKRGSIIQFATTKLKQNGKFDKNKIRFEIWGREKDGIKFIVKKPDDTIFREYTKSVVTSEEFKNLCINISKDSSGKKLDEVSVHVYELFQKKYETNKIDEHILNIENEFLK